MTGNKDSPHSAVRRLRTLLRYRGALIGLIVIMVMAVFALLPGLVAPFDPNDQNLLARFTSPGASRHVLGTDNFGRDLFSRLVWGARTSLSVSVCAVSGSLLIGAFLGLTSGYFGGHLEQVIMRLIDALMAFPSILLALAIIAVLGSGFINLVIALTVAGIPPFARLTRGETLHLVNLPYIEGARAAGASHWRIIGRHLLPNSLAPIVVLGSLRLSTAILSESSLSFLGLGLSPTIPSWGATVADGIRYIQVAPWIPIFSGLIIMVTVLAFNLFGDGIRDILDPRLRGAESRQRN